MRSKFVSAIQLQGLVVGRKTEMQAGLRGRPPTGSLQLCSFVLGQNLRTVGWFAFRVFSADIDRPWSNFKVGFRRRPSER